MENQFDELEEFWDRLLSREAGQIKKAFSGLNAEEQAAILKHLHRMVEEPGWYPEQRASAKAALEAIQDRCGDLFQ